MIKRRLSFSLWSLLYGLPFWLWAMLGSGGGHYNLPIEIASPVGFVLWPAVWFVAYDLRARWARITFLALIAAHFSILAAYLLDTEARTSDAYWFNIAVRNSPGFQVFPWCAVMFLAGGQLYLWRRMFLRNQLCP